MTRIEFIMMSPIVIDLPESITVAGETVKGGFYDDDHTDEKYWQYQSSAGGGRDWIIWINLFGSSDSVLVRATCGNEDLWVWDDWIEYDKLAWAIKEAVEQFNEYYRKHKEE